MPYIGYDIDLFMEDIRELIARVDLEGIRRLLSRHRELANAGIALGSQDASPAHPLHRICDGVHRGVYSDEQARDMAQVFVDLGADVNGVELVENRDSPLTAAASLFADLTGMYYIDQGASISHPGCHGGTALHWAAWCGRDLLVKKLIDAGAPLEQRCKDFRSTPLFWAIHGYVFEGGKNRYHQVECAQLLIRAGANKDTRNAEGWHIRELLDANDSTLQSLLS
ncbi:MAG TPA: ankyrin repeat domain-containing protein [Chryseolinea sp.]|nr:ankyrin repeat domain-containing protein [Chryseolinea sp.]